MERRELWFLDWIDVVQFGVIATGILSSAVGARKLDAAYPLESRMEPLVGTPIGAWSVFWLGVGLVVFGVGMTTPSVLEAHDVALFSERQRSGLVLSGSIILLPSLFAGVGIFLAFPLLYVTVPAGLAGVATAMGWRVVELVWPRLRPS
ncbi:hypothetical protein [Haloarcula salinisoli]|uniref:Uncharacterized protein n=1 Tax=Haloarcula salinisoli TaxID=2487746 RepID=A0A8J7YIZ1_9EURY|nr:hypothetical protein [Halomicroarcula salinisoli]MBX0286658.1 hypothetical protein [Halomicroarcula salinisoli]MBX0303969.1 hypothetical protein [Halomicroarcula salinisoli]